jgi:hypothetical protein
MTNTKSRILKVEVIGDHWKGKTIPRIRLKGQWLAQAGITENSFVEVSNPCPGQLVITTTEKEKIK